MTDFGNWLTKAFSETFPDAIQTKCYYHMKQNIKKNYPKHFQYLELYLDALSSCIYENDFDNLWKIIKKDILKDQNLNQVGQKFIDYYEGFYLKTENKGFYIGALPPGYGSTNNGL